MHQSFVTTACKGPGKRGNFYFSLCKARLYAQHCREIFMAKVLPKALLKCRQVNVELLQPIWAWNQTPRSSMALRDNTGLKVWHLSSLCHHYPDPARAVVTNDWCINLKKNKFVTNAPVMYNPCPLWGKTLIGWCVQKFRHCRGPPGKALNSCL